MSSTTGLLRRWTIYSGTAKSTKYRADVSVVGRGLRDCSSSSWEAAAFELDPRDDVLIDLRSCRWIDSGFLVRLACVIDRAVRDGRTVVVVCDPTSDAVRYASRLGLRAFLDNRGVDHNVPETGEYPSNERFLELQEFGSGQPADDLIDVIDRRLGEWGDGALQSVLYDAIYELGLNVEEHARRPGFVMAQWFRNARKLDISVADYGVGVRSSLAKGGLLMGDHEASIRAAVETRASAKGRDGGFGLMSVAHTTQGKRGMFTVTSGNAGVSYWPSGARRAGVARERRWSGTAIDIQFRW